METRDRLRFGDFELDRAAGRLRCRGTPVRIQPQPLRVLTALVERGGEVVSRDALRRSIWDSATFVEFDQGLNFCVRQIRLALDDNAATPIYVETIKKQGYRLIAPVTRESARPDSAAEVETGPPARVRPRWPVILDRLVAREHEIAHVMESLRHDVLVTLTGPGGVGKTRLAIECARLFDEAQNRVQWIDLTEASQPVDVLPTIARAVGLAEAAPQALAPRLRDFLAGRNDLFVFDNFEHVLEAAPALLEIRESETPARFLVTSRVRLHLRGEREVVVSPLRSHRDDADRRQNRPAPAVELFVDRLGASNAVQSSGALARDDAEMLCARLDGLPLAIELAAARARVLSPADLLRHDRLITLLTSGPRDAPDRQQTLVRTLEWSYNLLPDDARQSLRILAVFAGGFTVSAGVSVLIESGVASSEHAALDLLDTLRDHSLIARAPSSAGHERWHLLETVREFALEQRSTGETADAERARAQYVVVWIQQETPALRTDADTAAMPGLLDEHANLLAALRWAEASNPDTLVRLVNAATWFWHTANLSGEAREWTTAAIRALTSIPGVDPLSVRRLLAADALHAYHLGLVDQALDPAARVVAGGALDFDGILACCLEAALLAFAGDLSRAGDAAAMARDSAAALDDPWLQGFAAYGSALAAALDGQHALAERYLAEAPRGLGFVSILIDLNRGLQQIEQGKIADALSSVAVYVRQRYGGYHPIRQIAAAVEVVAYAAGLTGDWDTCARLLARADRWRVETMPLHPTWRRQHDRALEGARANLGARFERVWTEGASLTLDAAVELAAQTAGAATDVSVLRDPGRPPAH